MPVPPGLKSFSELMGESERLILDIFAKGRVACLTVLITLADKFRLCSDMAMISDSNSLESAMKLFQWWLISDDAIPLTF